MSTPSFKEIKDVKTWVVFAICVGAAGAALAWVTVRAMHLETSEKQARADAAFQEKVRLALWRMDSTIAPVLAIEASRPYFHYRSFYPADRAVTRLLEDITPGEILVPSPLLEGAGAHIKLHFQIEADGTVTSPQAPSGNLLDLAEGQHVAPAQIETAINRLATLTTIVRGGTLSSDRQSTLGHLETEQLEPGAHASTLDIQDIQDIEIPTDHMHRLQGNPVEHALQRNATPSREPASIEGEDVTKTSVANRHPLQDEDASLREKLIADVQQRRGSPSTSNVLPGFGEVRTIPDALDDAARNLKPIEIPALGLSPDVLHLEIARDENTVHFVGTDRRDRALASYTLSQSDITQEPFAAQWRSGLPGPPELVFTRRITYAGQSLAQGFWLDWPAVEAELLTSAHSLLPDASLVPIYEASQREAFRNQGRLLATVPVVFEPGTSPPVATSILSPTRLGLLVAWASLGAAAVGIGVVLRKSMELASRRGRFVSAVTHELRTPLTSFCLYTDLLAHNMVTDDAAKSRSLDTLHREAQRLAGIVENVLAYARLGKGKRTRSHARTPIIASIVRSLPTLRDAADRAGMELVTNLPDSLIDLHVTADATTIERICSNLVDNACKYGRPERDDVDPVIELSVTNPHRQWVEVCVRDDGPGVAHAERSRIFKPFEQVDRDGKAEGLGLGLALSRQLAQQAGGDLSYRAPTGTGAMFVLRLPVAAHEPTDTLQ